MEYKVSKEAALKEVTAWLDFHEITEDSREAFDGNINIIVNGIRSGNVTIDSNTNILTQRLKHPFGKEFNISELKFKAGGLPIGEVENNKTNIDKENDNRKSLAHMAVATNTAVEVLMKMSTKDLNTSLAIIIFFIV